MAAATRGILRAPVAPLAAAVSLVGAVVFAGDAIQDEHFRVFAFTMVVAGAAIIVAAREVRIGMVPGKRNESGWVRGPSYPPRIGRPRRSAAPLFAHIRSRSSQKSRTARKTTRGFAPLADPAVRG